MISLALALTVAASPAAMPFAEAPAVEVWASEDWPADMLAAAAALPGASLGLFLKSNMIRPEALAVLARRPCLVRLAADLKPAHVEQLRKLPRSVMVIALKGPLDPAAALKLAKLGPQGMRVQVPKMDGAIARSLAELKNAEVELDVRGRVPDQEELGVFLGLTRARRVVRLRADDPPALVAALKTARPVRLVVESNEGRLPKPMVDALLEAAIATRVVIDLRATSDDLKRLAALPQISLELTLAGEPEAAMPAARQLLVGLVLER